MDDGSARPHPDEPHPTADAPPDRPAEPGLPASGAPVDRREASREDGAGDRREAPRADPVERAREDALYELARSAEHHDSDTGRHLLRIRDLVTALARRLGVEDPEALGVDAMLHDVGKLRVPGRLLRKAGPLTGAERELVERHTIEGERLLDERPGLRRAAAIARAHHEQWDGGGYPDGLVGTDIPLAARITAVADVFDALVSRRAYKPAASVASALADVRELAGTHLDPAIVDALVALERDGALPSTDDAHAA